MCSTSDAPLLHHLCTTRANLCTASAPAMHQNQQQENRIISVCINISLKSVENVLPLLSYLRHSTNILIIEWHNSRSEKSCRSCQHCSIRTAKHFRISRNRIRNKRKSFVMTNVMAIVCRYDLTYGEKGGMPTMEGNDERPASGRKGCSSGAYLLTSGHRYSLDSLMWRMLSFN